jgi:hypothetical protein
MVHRYNFYRASGDVINSFERIYHNVHSLLPFLGSPPLSRPGSWAYADGMELGRMSGPYRDAEDRTIFGWYVITSNPLYLGHNISDDATNDRVWPVVSNIEAIRINQQWLGHPGRLVKTWGSGEGVTQPTGRGVYNVTCDSSDKTQLQWSYNASSMELTHQYGNSPPKCMDQSSDNRQIWIADCDAKKKSQRWQFGKATARDGYAVLQSLAHAVQNVSVPGAQNSVGFARKGAKFSTLMRIDPQTGQLKQITQTPGKKAGAPACISSRAINPVNPNSTYELWSKPVAGGKTAALLVNNGLPAEVAFSISELGLAGALSVRNVWNHTDEGEISAGGQYSAHLGTHDSVLLLLAAAKGV